MPRSATEIHEFGWQFIDTTGKVNRYWPMNRVATGSKNCMLGLSRPVNSFARTRAVIHSVDNRSLIRSGEAWLVGWSRQMLYSGFNILPRSVFWSADFNGRSDNLDVIRAFRIDSVKDPLAFLLSCPQAVSLKHSSFSFSTTSCRI